MLMNIYGNVHFNMCAINITRPKGYLPIFPHVYYIYYSPRPMELSRNDGSRDIIKRHRILHEK